MANRGEISAINCLFYLLKNEQAPFSAPHSTELRAGFARAKRGSLDLTLAKMKRRPQGSSFSFWRRYVEVLQTGAITLRHSPDFNALIKSLEKITS